MQTVHLAIYPTLADWEYGYVAAGINNPEYQREPGAFRIVTVGASPDPIRTIGGLTIVPDTTLDDVSPSDSAMLVLPGAQIWDANDEFVAAARRWVEAGVPVAGICGATVGLARAGLLDDRAHTSNAAAQLEPTGYAGAANYVDAPAVTDRGVVTAAAVAPVDFAREVFALLGVYDQSVLDAWYRLYAHQDPSGFYALTGPE
ncbi:DJ-1/PfpI family protein [Gordonia hankookensis]|uniref:DJ-1/PfpI family protein n=1 Tax=Gordonia hankookensis TaxID=589403 RepID=A0ABR7W8W4_9ACTN|nr:DJ-1/PfpI family protein [Gordonia hankookensis]MBD1319265.1 DJ-1/PfpI family protein [Gordonia hankookensis]